MLGETISHYRITKQLGAGGMGVVYEAEDLELGRRVALKFLPPDYSGQKERAREQESRFLREAKTAAALDHPNICTIHEIARHDERTFIVMALVEGEDLRNRLDGSPLPVASALDIAIQVASGLEAAHGKDIIHRDIKPANVMIGADGRVQIMDFGLAKLVDATALTRSATTLGTAAYMAPEQIYGNEVGPSTDLWSLGVVLYEMLSGRRPFQAESAPSIMHRILEEEPKPLSAVCEGVPESLDWIIDKCLTKEPNARYSSASELLHDLTALRGSLAASDDRTLTVLARPARAKARRPGVLAALVVVVGLLGLGYLLRDGLPARKDDAPAVGEAPSWSDPPRVVVTTFENQTGDTALDYVAGLASDAISNDLAAAQVVEVVPFAMDDSPEAPPLSAVLDASGADVAVTGAFYVQGGTLTIQARVVDARTGALIFAVPTIDTMKDAPREGIRQAAQRVAGGLAFRLDNPLNLLAPQIPPTYEAYREFRNALESFLDGRPRVMEELRAAESLDPAFTRPRVFVPLLMLSNPLVRGPVAQTDTLLMELEADPALDSYDRAIVGMVRAVVNRNADAGLSMALRLTSLAPDDRMVRAFLMIRQQFAGRPEAALETYRSLNLTEEEQRRPTWAGLTRIIAYAPHRMGRFDLELELRRRLLAHYPEQLLFQLDLLMPFAALGEIDSMKVIVDLALRRPGTRGSIDYQVWGASAALRGHGHAEMAAPFVDWYLEQRPERPADDERLIQMNNFPVLLYHAERLAESRVAFEANITSGKLEGANLYAARLYLGFLAARRGDEAFVREVIEELVDTLDDPYDRSHPWYLRAQFAALSGDREEAIRLLEVYAAHGGPVGHPLRHEINFEPLFGDPAFEELTSEAR